MRIYASLFFITNFVLIWTIFIIREGKENFSKSNPTTPTGGSAANGSRISSSTKATFLNKKADMKIDLPVSAVGLKSQAPRSDGNDKGDIDISTFASKPDLEVDVNASSDAGVGVGEVENENENVASATRDGDGDDNAEVKAVVKGEEVIVGLPPASLTLTGPEIICESPTETEKIFDLGVEGVEGDSKEKEKELSANGFGLPDIPSPTVVDPALINKIGSSSPTDTTSNSSPSTPVPTPRQLSFADSEKTPVSRDDKPRLFPRLSKSKRNLKEGKKSNTLPSPSDINASPSASASVSSFAVICGSRTRFNSASASDTGHIPNMRPVSSNMYTNGDQSPMDRRSKRRSKMFFLGTGSGSVVDEVDHHSPISGSNSSNLPGSKSTFSRLGGSIGVAGEEAHSPLGDGPYDGMTILRTACAGERDIWIEKMKECGIIVVTKPSVGRSRSRLSKTLSRPKSAGAVTTSPSLVSTPNKEHPRDEDERTPASTPTPTPKPTPIHHAISDPLPTASTTFRLESRWGRGKAMSDIGHGGELSMDSNGNGNIPRSRSSFMARFPPGISISKDISLSSSYLHLRTPTTSQSNSNSSHSMISSSHSSLPYTTYTSLLRSGSKRVFHYSRASAPPTGSPGLVVDTGAVDEGIMDIASDVLIRKRHKAKMMGEPLFPLRPQLSAVTNTTANANTTLSSNTSTKETSPNGNSATSNSSSTTPGTTPEEAMGTTFAQSFESFKRASTLVRLQSVRSVISIGNSVSDAMSSAGIRRSVTVGNIGRKGKGRMTELDTNQSSSVPTSATNSPITGTFDLPPVVSGEELSTFTDISHLKSASSPAIYVSH